MVVKMKMVDDSIEDEDLDSNIDILKLSASSIKTYEQCPKKYYYTYIEKVPRKQWDHFDLGNICHKVLEIFHQTYIENGDNTSLNKIMSYAFSEARKSFEDINSNILVEAKDLTANYLKAIYKNGMPNVRGVETSFNFNIQEDIKLRGFLDRIDIVSGSKYHIVDYKTTKNPKYLDPFQLLLYGLWLKNEYPHIDGFKASYVLLRHNSKLISYDFNDYDVEQVRKKVLDFANKIRISQESESWVTIPTPLCNWCDFKNICPAQKGW